MRYSASTLSLSLLSYAKTYKNVIDHYHNKVKDYYNEDMEELIRVTEEVGTVKECTICKESKLHFTNAYDICIDCTCKCTTCQCCATSGVGNTKYTVVDSTGAKKVIDLCETCVSEYYQNCDSCGELLEKSYIERIAVSSEDYNPNNKTLLSVCTNCKKNYTKCTICGVLEHKDNLKFCGECERYTCRSCYKAYHKEYCINNDVIHDYHELPTLEFRQLEREFKQLENYKTSDFYFGFELELELKTVENRTIAKTLYPFHKKYPKHIWASRDSSIRSGLEFISHPCSLGYYQEIPFIKNFLECIEEIHNKNEKLQGLHIHASKITDKKANKYLNMFMFYNRSLLELVANRSTSYAVFPTFNTKEEMISYYIEHKETDTRRSALNLTNVNTIELRIFTGIPDAEYILSCIELFHVLLTHAKQQAKLYSNVTEVVENYSNTLSLDRFIKLVNSDIKYSRAKKLLTKAGA